MNIIQSSIKLITPLFNNWEKEFAAIDYQVSFEAFSFQLKATSKEFTLEDLQAIVNFIPKPQGYLDPISFKDAESTINKYLAYTSTSVVEEMNYEGFKEVPCELAEKRRKTFWDIVATEFPLPPDYCLEHSPAPESYFSDFMMWHFTFCFFKGKKGLIIHGCAYD